MKAIIGTMLALALFSSALPASASTGERGRRTTIVIDGDGCYYYRSDRRGRYMPPERWSLRLGAGIVSEINVDNFIYDYGWSDDWSLSECYEDYHGLTMTAGSWSVGADYRVARWFAVSADIGVDFLWHDMYDGVSGAFEGVRTGVSLTVLPQAKFYYLTRPAVRLYGYIGVGLVKYFGYDGLRNSRRDGSGVHFVDETFEGAFQYAPLGIEAGRRWFGFAELGYGTLFSGLRAGFGFRF